jgi:choline monooxygenase
MNQAVRLADDELGENLERWQTLDPEWYTSPEIFRLEQEHIFQRAWQYAGPADAVSKPGDYFTCEAGQTPVVVTRDREGRLNAFLNVCRHRAYVVADGCGNARALRCGYHGWTYDMDGALMGAPHSEGDPDFDKCKLSLLPISVEQLGPFVFVNPDRNCGPLEELTGNLLERLAARGWDADRFDKRVRRVHELDWNWKLMMENDECYHCAVLHPRIAESLDTRPSSMSVTRHNERFWDFATPDKGERPAGPVTDDEAFFVNHYFWPNFWLVTRRGGMTYTGVTLPVGPERCRLVTDYWFPQGESDEDIEATIDLAESILAEDFAVLPQIQANHRTGLGGRGQLNKRMEGLIRAFEQEVHRAVVSG